MTVTTTFLAALGAGALTLSSAATGAVGDSPDSSSDSSSAAAISNIQYHDAGPVAGSAISRTQLLWSSTFGGSGRMALDPYEFGIYEFRIYTTDAQGVTSGSTSTQSNSSVAYDSTPGQAGRGNCYWLNNTDRWDLLSDMSCFLEVSTSTARSSSDLQADEETSEDFTNRPETDSSNFDAVVVDSSESNDYVWSTFEAPDGEVCLNGTSQINSDYAVTTCAAAEEVRDFGLSVRFQSGDGGDERAYYMPPAQKSNARTTSNLASGEIVVMNELPKSEMARGSDTHEFEMTSDSGEKFTFLKFDSDREAQPITK